MDQTAKESFELALEVDNSNTCAYRSPSPSQPHFPISQPFKPIAYRPANPPYYHHPSQNTSYKEVPQQTSSPPSDPHPARTHELPPAPSSAAPSPPPRILSPSSPVQRQSTS
ncbi:hypothetical protein Scep_007221 [Stephania cephalantha]|uniref:Uncharacterized protein n=1 Tax=Stephania cephalantha TaxID=152367 RepID=A0AAP0PN09_9MAGN